MANATKQKYRGNPAEKMYEFLTDFSGGINQKLEDSLIKDNQARDVNNFDIISGGLLSKRRGFAPLNILNMLVTALGKSKEEIESMKVNKTFDFYNGDENVLCLLTADSIMINIIFSGSKVRKITQTILGTQNASVEIFGIKPILIYSKDAGNQDRTMELDIWINDNWQSAVALPKEQPKDVTIDDSFDAAQTQIDASDLFSDILGTSTSPEKAKYVYMFANIDDDDSAHSISNDHYGLTDTLSGNKNGFDKFNFPITYEFKFHEESALWADIKDTTKDIPYTRQFTFFSLGQLLKIEEGFKYEFDPNTFKFTFSVDTKIIARLFFGVRVSKALYKDIALTTDFEIDAKDLLPSVPDGPVRDGLVGELLQRLVRNKVFVKVITDYVYPATDSRPDSPVGKAPYPPEEINFKAYLVEETDFNNYSVYRTNTNDAQSSITEQTKTFNDLTTATSKTENGKSYWKKPTGTFVSITEADDDIEPNVIRKHSINIDYTVTKLVKADSIDSNHITKYIPDAFSMQNLSYNLLTLNKNDDPFKFNQADPNRVYVDKVSEVPTLDGIIQLNGYYAQVGVQANYKASLNLPTTDTRSEYHFGYTIMPLEQWNKVQQSPENNGEYIKQVISPSFLPDASGNKKTSEFGFTPQSASQYVISVFTFKIDTNIFEAKNSDGSSDTVTNSDPYQWLNAYVDEQNKNGHPIRIDFILSSTSNINVTESFGMNQSPSEVVKNFHNIRKSLSWKNQMILYGGSNTFFVSDVNNFSYFPMLNNFQIPTDSEIVSMVVYFDSVIIATDREQFVLTGNSPATFKINELNNDIGVVAEKTVKNNANFIFQLTANGVYKVKTLFNFEDRYNVEKVDEAIASSISGDPNSSSAVWNNKYYICIPSEKTIWIYYNDYKAWIKYESELFELSDIRVIQDDLFLISKSGLNVLRFSQFISNEHGEGGYTDYDMHGNKYPVKSVYKSKQIDFGLPNHDKKFKKLHVRFAETPGKNELFTTVWVDSKIWVDPEKVTVSMSDSTGQVVQTVTRNPSIVTTALSIHDLPDSTYSSQINNIGNKYDEDVDQLHEIIVAARGRQIQFQIEHSQDKKLNIKNFGNLLKVKKPKALRTSSKKA